MLQGVVDHLVDDILVERGAAAGTRLAREAHAAHAEQADALTAQRLPGAMNDLVTLGGFDEFPVLGKDPGGAQRRGSQG